MATIEEFTKLVQDVLGQFQNQLTSEKLHDFVYTLKPLNQNKEIVRILFLEDKSIGISFQIEVVSTDAIQIFSNFRHLSKEIKLLPCFYINSAGEICNGIDAQIMCEHDRENRYLSVLQSRTKAQETENYELEKMKKNGKITFH